MRKLLILIACFFNSFIYGQKQPNIIFILADDVGINALNCYGNDLVESPNIDKLYNEGMHFTNGYSNDPTCAPSRGSIMTGQYVPRHKIYRVADRFKMQKNVLEHMKYLPPPNNTVEGSGVGLSLEKVTMGDIFQKNGYRTGAFGKWHLGKNDLAIPHQGFDEGFEVNGHYNFTTHPEQNVTDPNLYSSDYVAEKSIDFMTRAVKDENPFFLYVPFYLIHKPFEPKAEYLKHFQEVLKDKEGFGETEAIVLAMLKSLDDNVGQLMKAVTDLDIEEETIIVFTSDNGHYKTDANIFNQPYRGHKGEAFEGGIRVPYIFKWKNKIEVNSVSAKPIIHVDLYPTLLDLATIKPEKRYPLDGESISPILFNTGKKMQRDALVWEYTNYAAYSKKTKTFKSEWVNVIQMNGYKLTEVVETDSYYLYNLNTDPYETKEASAANPQIVKKLKKRLEEWKKDVGYVGPIPNPAYKKAN